MKAVILDTIENKRALHYLNGSPYMWAEGNYSCDCNRGFAFESSDEDDDDSYKCGHTRYLVVEIIPEPDDQYALTLQEVNASYPQELLDLHLP